MANFVKCEIPDKVRINRSSYGENQRLINAFVESGYECAKVIDFVGNVKQLSGRLTRCAKKLNLIHIKACRVGDDVYLINTLIKEN